MQSNNMTEESTAQNSHGSRAPGRVMGIGSLVCFAVALAVLVLFLTSVIYGYFQGGRGEMAGAGWAVLEMGLIHTVGMLGVVFGYVARHANALARLGMWASAILLVVFWLGMALSPV